MSKNSCTHEILASSKYCSLAFCRECSIIHFNLPYRISLQFQALQFLEIADAFGKAARQFRMAENSPPNDKAAVNEFKKILH